MINGDNDLVKVRETLAVALGAKLPENVKLREFVAAADNETVGSGSSLVMKWTLALHQAVLPSQRLMKIGPNHTPFKSRAE